ncbi:MAG: glutamate dehydrogenase [Winogradskyella sp.]|nr:glutamate dehydrogenase [Winogradskyella sp.]
MYMILKKLLLAIVLFVCIQSIFAQRGFSHEIGVITGPIAYQSDFGERGDFQNNTSKVGFGIGIVYYMNFDYLATYRYNSLNNYFTDHFKLRGEISWNKTTLEHYGTWVDPARTSIDADKLRAHSGEAQNFNLGVQLEYYPISVKAFSQGVYSFAPFVSFGTQFVAYSPSAKTSYGDQNIENADNFYSGWEPGSVSEQNGTTLSLVGSIGTRYKLGILSDLMIDLRFQSFFSNSTDGLDHQLPSNKTNDWLVWLNFGYIYYFD